MKNQPAEPEAKTPVEPKEETETSWERPRRYGIGGAIFPLILITIGLIFLLNNFNIVSWDVWATIWRFWPVLIIISGLSLIFGRTRIGGIVTLLVSLILIALVILISVATANGSFRQNLEDTFPIWKNIQDIVPKAEERTLDLAISSEKYKDISERSVSVKIGSGDLTMTDGNTSDYFKLHSVYFTSGGKPVVKDSDRSGKLNIDFSTESYSGFFLGDFRNPSYEITLGQPSLVTDFEFNQGSGSSEVDFSEVKVKSITVDLGSGSMSFTFGSLSVPTEKSTIDMGSGNIKIILPKETAVKVSYDMGSGNLSINSNSFSGDGVYTSDNYSQAASKFDLRLKMGSGNFTIETR